MWVLAGLDLGGAMMAPHDRQRSGALGRVAWGPTALLRDLELRLGLAPPVEPHTVRVARYAARMAKLAPQGRYYSRSFAVDALGTAAFQLSLRDLLVEAGWTGQLIAQGGDRLAALHELETLADPPLPPGPPDRVAALVAELRRRNVSPYAELNLVESMSSWPVCWQNAFQALQVGGAKLQLEESALVGAPSDTDLGRLQRVLCGAEVSQPTELRGDGTVVVITAETSWEAGQAAAALLGCLPAQETVVLREQDASALDGALATAGLRTQGLSSSSPWRSVLQVLPLALELAFEPKDPYRILELLTLPVGPFAGFVGHALARALGQSPGIGSPAWEAVKAKLPARQQDSGPAPEHLVAIAEWLETPGVEALTGAPIAMLVTVVARVRAWLLSRIAAAPDDPLLLAAARQSAELRVALENDPRPALTLVQLRKLAESVLGAGVQAQLFPERAGRRGWVDSASHLRAPVESVVWWSFTGGPSGVAQLPWRGREAQALRGAGLHFPEPAARLADRAAAARVAFSCAKQRLVLVMPRERAGQLLSPHPLWDELLASARLDESALSRITVSARTLREPASTQLLAEPLALTSCESLELPGGHSEWNACSERLAPLESFSPASLEALLGCPLEWALRYRAGVRSGGHVLPPLYLLSGTLGHRLVELLHRDGAFEVDDAVLRQHAGVHLQRLFQQEGAVLLRPGMGLERAQLQQQLLRAVVDLSRLLKTAGLRIIAVEKDVEVSWELGRLEGRLDLLVATQDGRHGVIDMKSGMSTYRDLLSKGQALQLAAYAFAHAAEHPSAEPPDAGYFSLKQGKLFGLASRVLPHTYVIQGPGLKETWERVGRSLRRVLPLAQHGRFPVTGVRGAPPLLEALGVPEAEASTHFARPSGARCQYCSYDALCGRRWEALQ